MIGVGFVAACAACADRTSQTDEHVAGIQRIDQAATALRGSLDVHRRTIGPHPIRMFGSLCRLGDALDRVDQDHDATAWTVAIEGSRAAQIEGPFVARCFSNLVRCYGEQGQFDRTCAQLEEGDDLLQWTHLPAPAVLPPRPGDAALYRLWLAPGSVGMESLRESLALT